MSVSNGNFPDLNGLAVGSATTTATLNFACTGMVPAVPISLCPNLDAGSGGTDGSGGRYLASGTSTLVFQVYQDSNRTIPWGSSALLAFGATPTITITPGVSGAASTSRTLYAKVSAPSTAAAATYTSNFANQGFFWGLNVASCAGVTIGTFITPATFTFTAKVTSNCTLTATDMKFGTVTLLNVAKVASNTIGVQCTPTTPYTLGLNNGLLGTGPTVRMMAQGAARVTYGIYKDPGYAQPWGDASLGAGYVQAATGNGAVQNFTGYGQVAPQATPMPGLYSDTVVATLTY